MSPRRAPISWLLTFAVGCGASTNAEPAPAAARAPVLASPTPHDAELAALGLSASVDPARGLVVVAHIEDASDGEAPPMIVSGHRCARQEIDAVAAMLSDYLSDRRAMDGVTTAWTCDGDRCELRGMMEFDPTRAIRFDHRAVGSLIVVGLDFYEDVGSGPEHVAEVRAQVDRDHVALRGPCP